MNRLTRTLLAASIGTLTACGGSSGDSPSGASPQPKAGSYIYYGTVPGTLIEAFCDNGAYYATESIDDGSSDQHPFELELPAGLACHLVMTTNEDDPAASVTTPVAFLDGNGELSTRARGADGLIIDLGFVPLYTSRDDAAGADLDDDGILDTPLELGRPLRLEIELHENRSALDPDGNGIVQYYDDEDDDGIPNHADDDYSRHAADRDRDGLDDAVDVNPDNDPDDDNRYPETMDHDGDGYLDEDGDRDGYYDDDHDRDGFHDDDHDRDGFHDDDHDRDGFRDSPHGDDIYGEVRGMLESVDGAALMLRVTASNDPDIAVGTLIDVDASQARFEDTSQEQLQVGDPLEVKGRWDGVQLLAFKVESDDGSNEDAAADDSASDSEGDEASDDSNSDAMASEDDDHGSDDSADSSADDDSADDAADGTTSGDEADDMESDDEADDTESDEGAESEEDGEDAPEATGATAI